MARTPATCHFATSSSSFADKIDDAAKVLSEKSYPFLKEIDWTSDVYGKLPTQPPLEVLKAINTMLKMGASMDSAALKSGALAHSQAIANMDSKGVAALADYTAINGNFVYNLLATFASVVAGLVLCGLGANGTRGELCVRSCSKKRFKRKRKRKRKQKENPRARTAHQKNTKQEPRWPFIDA